MAQVLFTRGTKRVYYDTLPSASTELLFCMLGKLPGVLCPPGINMEMNALIVGMEQEEAKHTDSKQKQGGLSQCKDRITGLWKPSSGGQSRPYPWLNFISLPADQM